MYSQLGRTQAFEIYAGVQGIYTFSQDRNRVLYSTLDQYKDIELFYHKIGIADYMDYQSPEMNIEQRNEPNDTCIIYNLRPVDNSFSKTIDGERITSIQLDLYIKVSKGSFRLYNGNLETYYNTTMFGTNVVANGKITAVKSTAFAPNYSLTLTDEASDKIKINLLGNSVVASSLQLIDTGYKYVARFTIELQGWDGKSALEWDELTVDNDKYSEEGTNVIRNFGCEEIQLGVNCGMEISDITDIAAAGAGIETELNTSGILEIYGEGFLADDVTFGNCEKPIGHFVKFKTIHNQWIAPLEGDYIEFTDNLIRVKVPTIGFIDNSDVLYTDLNDGIAATGQIRVCRDGFLGIKCGCFTSSDEALFIPHAFRNDIRPNVNGCEESKESILRNENTQGGYTMRFHPNFKSYTGAVSAFKRALQTWRCETFINMDEDEIGTTLDGPGICVIKMEALPVGTKASTTDGYNICGIGTNFEYTMRQAGFLIRVNSGYSWHTGVDMPILDWVTQFDMETTILHELGHGFTMQHTSNESSIMLRPSLPQYKRSLAVEDKNGGNHVALKSSQQLTTLCSDVAMTLLESSDCMLGNLIQSEKEYFSYFPNPVSNYLEVKSDFLIKCFEILDVYGNILFTQELVNDNQMTIATEKLAPGIYFLKVYTLNSIPIISKMIKI